MQVTQPLFYYCFSTPPMRLQHPHNQTVLHFIRTLFYSELLRLSERKHFIGLPSEIVHPYHIPRHLIDILIIKLFCISQTVLHFIQTLVYSELLRWLATLYSTERPVTACGRYSLRGRCALRNANIALVCIPRLSIPIISHAIWYITLATHSKTDRHRLRLRRFTTRGCCAFRNANASLVYISRAIIREYGRPRPQYRYKHSAPLLPIFFCGRDAQLTPHTNKVLWGPRSPRQTHRYPRYQLLPHPALLHLHNAGSPTNPAFTALLSI